MNDLAGPRLISRLVGANVAFGGLLLAFLALGRNWQAAVAHPYMAAMATLVFELLIVAYLVVERSKATGADRSVIDPTMFQREALVLRHAKPDDFEGIEAVFDSLFSRDLAIDDLDFFKVLGRAHFIRVAEERRVGSGTTVRSICGYYTLWPISQGTFQRLVAGSLREEQISDAMILDFNDPAAAVIYVAEICAHKQSDIGHILAKDMLTYLRYLIVGHSHLKVVAAWPNTATGQRMVEQFKMKRCRQPTRARRIYAIQASVALATSTLAKRRYVPRRTITF